MGTMLICLSEYGLTKKLLCMSDNYQSVVLGPAGNNMFSFCSVQTDLGHHC
jgi:hypothetical protein